MIMQNRATPDPRSFIGDGKGQEMKELIYELNGRYPGLKDRVFGAMQRLPLPEWGPVEHRRRPLPVKGPDGFHLLPLQL